jgi:hypothetical protein
MIMYRTALCVAALGGIVAASTPTASAGVVDNLALNKPVTHTTDNEVWSATNFTDGLASESIWHFGGSYDDVILGGNPYFGAVEIAGANNTVSIKTVRLIGTYPNIVGAGQSPRSLTIQSRDSASDPLNATVDSGWTDLPGASFSGVVHANGSFTFDEPVKTRAIRVRITEMNAVNDRLAEIEAFSVDPHERNLAHILGVDPVLSRSDNVPLMDVTNLISLRDNNFDLSSTPNTPVSTTDDVMNYDYDFGSRQFISGVRLYANGAIIQVDIQIPDGLGGWTTIPGGTQTNPFNAAGNAEVYYFSFPELVLSTQYLRIHTRVRDVNNDARGSARAGEIEIYNFIPEPAVLGPAVMFGAMLLMRKRR